MNADASLLPSPPPSFSPCIAQPQPPLVRRTSCQAAACGTHNCTTATAAQICEKKGGCCWCGRWQVWGCLLSASGERGQAGAGWQAVVPPEPPPLGPPDGCHQQLRPAVLVLLLALLHTATAAGCGQRGAEGGAAGGPDPKHHLPAQAAGGQTCQPATLSWWGHRCCTTLDSLCLCATAVRRAVPASGRWAAQELGCSQCLLGQAAACMRGTPHSRTAAGRSQQRGGSRAGTDGGCGDGWRVRPAAPRPKDGWELASLA